MSLLRTLANGGRPLRRGFAALNVRFASTEPEAPQQSQEGFLYVDSVFPIQLGILDFRRYIGYAREESLLRRLQNKLSNIKAHQFEVLSVKPHFKDGGVFVHFKYASEDPDKALSDIQAELKNVGTLPSWSQLGTYTFVGGKFWLVKGVPWIEDMSIFPSPILKVAFEGPDVHEQTMYELFRPFGRIHSISLPQPAPAGTNRFATINYQSIHSATIARNVLHGFVSPSAIGLQSAPPTTRLKTTYEPPIQAHIIRDWISKHPRTFFPVLIFLLGTLTYTIFDPIRSFMVKGKMLDWFDVKESKIYKWLRANALERFYSNEKSEATITGNEMWKERKDADNAIRTYFADMPTTVTFLHGPQGSGKTQLLNGILKGIDRPSLIIDCREIFKASSDGQLISTLAQQTGYWPVFSFVNSLSNVIDLVSVGLIGQKAGLSSSLPDQVKDCLDVVSSALKDVSSSHLRQVKKNEMSETMKREHKAQEEIRRQRIMDGTWHDGRIDCIAGNGVMSELGFGDERIWDGTLSIQSIDSKENVDGHDEHSNEDTPSIRRPKDSSDSETIKSLPIVVIRNFAAKTAQHQEVMDVMAKWAANLAENRVAHVIVISDNRENAKRVAKALPTKPLNSVAFSDADSASALAFVRQKLADSNVKTNFTQKQINYIEQLGGRASDLESLIHQVRSGQSVEEAVEDIVNRGVAELRKNAFGDDVDDAQGLPWTKEQVWSLLKLLAKKQEVPYYDVLLGFPFKGDETPLWSMEHAELISISKVNGRPSAIRPGKPIFHWVFERLVKDPIFQASQDVSLNSKRIASEEATVKACEEELLQLKDIPIRNWFATPPTTARSDYLLHKMGPSVRKIKELEHENAELKKILAKDGNT